MVCVKSALIRHASMPCQLTTCVCQLACTIYHPTKCINQHAIISMQYAGMQYVNANMQCAGMQYVTANMQNAGMQYVNMQYVKANMQLCQCKHAICQHAIIMSTYSMQWLNMHLPACSMPTCKMSMYRSSNMYSHRWRNINLSGGHLKPPYNCFDLIKRNCVYKPLHV